MEWWFHLPLALWSLWVFLFGLGVGSFLNVVVARLPYEKSLIWPSSRCFVCFRKIRLTDNLPILGYFRLRGRCRHCAAPYSPRYLILEVATGLAFLGLFWLEIVTQASFGPDFLKPWFHAPGLMFPYLDYNNPIPHWRCWVHFVIHSLLLLGLLAAALIDAKHKIIPLQITYLGTAFGLLTNAIFPWPWPNGLADIAKLPVGTTWMELPLNVPIPNGLAMWPFWGPWPSWAPPGSMAMGLLTGLIGAGVGLLIGRGIKALFEVGLGKEALGLGDADLLMMAGSFLGWQAISLALPIGAVITLVAVVPMFLWAKIRGRRFDPALPFGPGIAAGVVACWLGWPWLGELVRAAYFDLLVMAILGGIVGGGLLLFGFLLRRPPEPSTAKSS